MRIDDTEVEEYIPQEEYPTECTYAKSANLSVLVKSNQFETWCRLDLHWIFSTMKWFRWN